MRSGKRITSIFSKIPLTKNKSRDKFSDSNSPGYAPKRDEKILEPSKEYILRKMKSDVEVAKVSSSLTETNTYPPEKYKNEIQKLMEYQKKAKMLKSRKTVAIPRKYWIAIEKGSPIQIQDLSKSSPSIFNEDPDEISRLLEKIQIQEEGKFDPLDESKPFWRRKTLKRKAQWNLAERNDETHPSVPYEAPTPVPRLPSLSSLPLAPPKAEAPLLIPQKSVEDARIEGERDLIRTISSDMPMNGAQGGGKRWHSKKLGCSLTDLSPKSQKNSSESSSQEEESSEKTKYKEAYGAQLISQLKRHAMDRINREAPIDDKMKMQWNAIIESYPGKDRVERRARLEQLDETLESLISCGKDSTENICLLLKSLAVQNKAKEGYEVMKKLIELQYPITAEHFSSLLYGCVLHKDVENAKVLYLKMVSLLIPPDNKVYSLMMKVYVSNRDTQAAYSLFRKAQDDPRVKMDVVIYTIMIDAFIKAKKFSFAQQLFSEMRTWKGIDPDEVLFTVMIKSCAKTSHVEKAFSFFDDMKDSGVYPTSETYKEMIRACSMREEFALKSIDFYNLMKLENIPICTRTYQRILEAISLTGDIKMCKKFVKEMRSKNEALTAHHYNAVLKTISNNMKLPQITDSERIHNIRTSWKVIKILQSNNVALTVYHLNEIMRTYSHGKFYKHAIDMLQQYPSYDVTPNYHTYNILLSMLCYDLKDVGRFFALWDMMLQNMEKKVQDIHFNPKLLHMALDMAIEGNSANRVLKILDLYIENEIFIDDKRVMERLSICGREIPEIHEKILRLLQVDRKKCLEKIRDDQEALEANMKENELTLAHEKGVTTKTPTDYDMIKKEYFKEKKRQQGRAGTFIARKDYRELRKKGGELYAQKKDRPRPHLSGL